MIINKYFEIVKKTTIDFKEKKIDAEDFKKAFNKLDKTEVYNDLDNNGYKGIGNYISTVAELEDQTTLESQWIIEIINLFYCFFIDNYDYVYAKDFYKFLKIGLNKDNKTPVKISFKLAIKNYLDKKISDYCLAYIAFEFLNNLGFFKKEINQDKKLFNVLKTALKLKPKKLLEDLNIREKKERQKINRILKEYI